MADIFRKKKSICFLVVCILLSGCCFRHQDTARNYRELSPGQYSVTDVQGHILTFSKKPQRIVSMYGASDEILLDLVPNERIIALSKWARDPEISNVVERAKKIPFEAKDNIEYLLSIKPDLVIARSLQNAEFIQSLRDTGIPVYVYNHPTSVNEVRDCIRKLAVVVGEQERGEKMLDKMDEEIELVRAKIGMLPENQKKCIMLYVGGQGVIGGKDTIFDDIAAQAQVINGCSKAGGTAMTTLPKEKIIEINPDVLLIAEWSRGGANQEPAKVMEEVLLDPSLKSVKAIRDRKVCMIPVRYTHCVSQYVAEGIKAVSEAVYGSK